MKKLLSTVCLFLAGLGATAQTHQPNLADGALLDGKTIVKMNMTGLATRNIGFYAERILTKRLSFQIGANIMPLGELPFVKQVSSKYPLLKDLAISSKSITPELRLYLGKGYGRGFYIAPYFRYETYNLSGLNIIHELGIAATEDRYKRLAQLKMGGDLSAMGAGLLLGLQWQFGSKKNIVLDWSMIGAHVGTAKVSLTGTLPKEVSDLTQEEINKFKSEVHELVKDFPELKNKLMEIGTRSSKLSTETPFGFFRMALSIGYRF